MRQNKWAVSDFADTAHQAITLLMKQGLNPLAEPCALLLFAKSQVHGAGDHHSSHSLGGLGHQEGNNAHSQGLGDGKACHNRELSHAAGVHHQQEQQNGHDVNGQCALTTSSGERGLCESGPHNGSNYRTQDEAPDKATGCAHDRANAARHAGKDGDADSAQQHIANNGDDALLGSQNQNRKHLLSLKKLAEMTLVLAEVVKNLKIAVANNKN